VRFQSCALRPQPDVFRRNCRTSCSKACPSLTDDSLWKLSHVPVRRPRERFTRLFWNPCRTASIWLIAAKKFGSGTKEQNELPATSARCHWGFLPGFFRTTGTGRQGRRVRAGRRVGRCTARRQAGDCRAYIQYRTKPEAAADTEAGAPALGAKAADAKTPQLVT
jgi:hypothetical protein